ncbi:hypothetical protein OIU84_018075 [Salix udensis]|uniref:Uncharacterized protein n=1 Tax=Salix udensis TaxID=889485 RepID=A0AAD6PMH9_9ROSI|nr:hypothetical protein OIU84_018075 [Salix udensis]
MGEGKIESCASEDTPEIDYSIENHPLSTSCENEDCESEAARLSADNLRLMVVKGSYDASLDPTPTKPNCLCLYSVPSLSRLVSTDTRVRYSSHKLADNSKNHPPPS